MAHDHDVYMVLADTAAQLLDESALREYAPRLEQLARRDQHRLYLAIAHRSWGVAHRLANEYDQSSARLNQAIELFEKLETNWQMGRVLFEMGELHRVHGDQTRARDHFSRALASFEAQKAKPDAERTQAALRAIGGQ